MWRMLGIVCGVMAAMYAAEFITRPELRWDLALAAGLYAMMACVFVRTTVTSD